MDCFLSTLNRGMVTFPNHYLYLLGLTALFISAKHEEVQSIPLDMIVNELGHKQFKVEEVLQMEKRIL